VRACPALSNTGEAFVNTALRTRAAQQRAEHAPESAQQSGHIVRRCVMQRFSDDQHPHRGRSDRRQRAWRLHQRRACSWRQSSAR
jgi:hypothetical protein